MPTWRGWPGMLALLLALAVVPVPAQVSELQLSPADPRAGVVRLRADLPPGTYTLAWQSVFTLDGDRLAGQYRFHVRRAPVERHPRHPQAAAGPPPGGELGDAGWASVVALAVRWPPAPAPGMPPR